jgi:hypothetical protein
MYEIEQQKNTHQIRIIINATSGADSKTKSRWTRALQYAWHERRHWDNFVEFLQEQGGPAGCAELMGERRPAKQPRAIYYRRPDGRPILIVDRDL